MKVKYDNRVLEVTPRYVASLKEVLRAQLAMFRDVDPESNSWAWGQATIEDLSCADGVSFEFGGAGDEPDGFVGDVRVLSALEQKSPTLA